MNRGANLDVITTSVVVAAEAHNPTILHPAFLASEKIVPSDWKLGAEPPVSTPAISVVRYDNNISFLVDINKIQILDGSGRDESEIAEIAKSYVQKLPHVHYTAVGVNIAAFARCPDPEQWLLNRFIVAGPWSDAALKLKAAGLKLVYSVEKGVLNLNCEVGTIQPPNSPIEVGIAVNANYHTDISTNARVGETISALSLFRDRVVHFHQITKIVLQATK